MGNLLSDAYPYMKVVSYFHVHRDRFFNNSDLGRYRIRTSPVVVVEYGVEYT